MSLLAPRVPGAPAVPWRTGLLVAGGACLLLLAVAFLPYRAVLALLAAAVLLAVVSRRRIGWDALLVLLVVTVLVVPVRRYEFPVPLPFALEPYRVIIFGLASLLLLNLLVDPEARWKRLAFGTPLALFLLSQVASMAANLPGLSAEGLGNNSVGVIVQAAFLMAVFVVVRQGVTGHRDVHLLLVVLVVGAAGVAVSAVVERLTGFNIFFNLSSFLPLTLLSDPTLISRVGGVRAYGSASHPIALAVVLTMLIPLAVYLVARSPWPRRAGLRRLLFASCGALLLLGAVVTVSRTAFVMLGVMAVAFAVLRPRAIGQLLVALVPVSVLLLVFARPAVVSMVQGLLDPDELIASQYTSAGTRGSGRLADLGPGLQQAALNPVFGTGAGSRITTGPDTNALILDNQLLSTLLESGALGLAAVLVMFLLPTCVLLRLGGRRSRLGGGDRDLAAALGVTMLAYTVTLYFFDAFAFQQALIVFYVLLGIASWLRADVSTVQPDSSAPTESRVLA